MESRHDRERDRRDPPGGVPRGRAGAAPPGPARRAGSPAPAPSDPARRRGGAGVCVYWVGWHSPLTLVEHVVVDAPRGISAESIRLASGISPADRVPSVDPEAVRLGIMTAIPAVADVRLERSLPDTIRLAVTTRTPAGRGRGRQGLLRDGRPGRGLRQGGARQGPAGHQGRARTPSGRSPGGSCWPSPRTCAPRSRAITRQEPGQRDAGPARRGDRALGQCRGLRAQGPGPGGPAAVKATRYDVSAPLLPTTSGSPTDVTSATG